MDPLSHYGLDRWISSCKLYDLLPDIDQVDRELHVADVIGSNGSYDLSYLSSSIPLDLCAVIQAVPILWLAEVGDCLAWHGSTIGEYSAKASFHFISAFPSPHQGNPNHWKTIWKLNMPQNHRFFVWLMEWGEQLPMRRGISEGSNTTSCVSIVVWRRNPFSMSCETAYGLK